MPASLSSMSASFSAKFPACSNSCSKRRWDVIKLSFCCCNRRTWRLRSSFCSCARRSFSVAMASCLRRLEFSTSKSCAAQSGEPFLAPVSDAAAKRQSSQYKKLYRPANHPQARSLAAHSPCCSRHRLRKPQAHSRRRPWFLRPGVFVFAALQGVRAAPTSPHTAHTCATLRAGAMQNSGSQSLPALLSRQGATLSCVFVSPTRCSAPSWPLLCGHEGKVVLVLLLTALEPRQYQSTLRANTPGYSMPDPLQTAVKSVGLSVGRRHVLPSLSFTTCVTFRPQHSLGFHPFPRRHTPTASAIRQLADRTHGSLQRGSPGRLVLLAWNLETAAQRKIQRIG